MFLKNTKTETREKKKRKEKKKITITITITISITITKIICHDFFFVVNDFSESGKHTSQFCGRENTRKMESIDQKKSNNRCYAENRMVPVPEHTQKIY